MNVKKACRLDPWENTKRDVWGRNFRERPAYVDD